MTGTTTRAHNGRPGADRRRRGPYVDGANALQLDYPDEGRHTDERGRGRTAFAPPQLPPTRRVKPVAQPSTVAPPLPISLPRAPFLVLMVSLVVVGVVGVLVLNTRINENAFRLDALRGQQSALDLQEQQLKQNLNELEAPGNLRAAANRLGLVPAGTPAFIRLPDGQVVGVPQPASGQQSSAAMSGR